MRSAFAYSLFILTIFGSQFAFGDCSPLEKDGKDFRAYQSDYHRFLEALPDIDPPMRFAIMLKSIDKNMRMLQKLSTDSNIPLDMMTDMKLILDYQIALQGADSVHQTLGGQLVPGLTPVQHLLNGLLGFERAIQYKLEKAQAQNMNCQILTDSK